MLTPPTVALLALGLVIPTVAELGLTPLPGFGTLADSPQCDAGLCDHALLAPLLVPGDCPDSLAAPNPPPCDLDDPHVQSHRVNCVLPQDMGCPSPPLDEPFRLCRDVPAGCVVGNVMPDEARDLYMRQMTAGQPYHFVLYSPAWLPGVHTGSIQVTITVNPVQLCTYDVHLNKVSNQGVVQPGQQGRWLQVAATGSVCPNSEQLQGLQGLGGMGMGQGMQSTQPSMALPAPPLRSAGPPGLPSVTLDEPLPAPVFPRGTHGVCYPACNAAEVGSYALGSLI